MKQIPKQQYFILVGIRELVKHYMGIIDELETMALQISGEIDSNGKPEIGGVTSSMILGHLDLDEALKQMDITVEKQPRRKLMVIPEEKKEEINETL